MPDAAPPPKRLVGGEDHPAPKSGLRLRSIASRAAWRRKSRPHLTLSRCRGAPSFRSLGRQPENCLDTRRKLESQGVRVCHNMCSSTCQSFRNQYQLQPVPSVQGRVAPLASRERSFQDSSCTMKRERVGTKRRRWRVGRVKYLATVPTGTRRGV